MSPSIPHSLFGHRRKIVTPVAELFCYQSHRRSRYHSSRSVPARPQAGLPGRIACPPLSLVCRLCQRCIAAYAGFRRSRCRTEYHTIFSLCSARRAEENASPEARVARLPRLGTRLAIQLHTVLDQQDSRFPAKKVEFFSDLAPSAAIHRRRCFSTIRAAPAPHQIASSQHVALWPAACP